MNIAFDGTIFASLSKNRGLGRFARELLKSLINQLKENDNLYLINYNDLDIDDEYTHPALKRLDIFLGPYKDTIRAFYISRN